MPIHPLRTSFNQPTPISAARSAVRAGSLGAALACTAAMLTACGSSGEAKRERIREVETELSVAQASTDLIATGVLDYSMAPDNEDDEPPEVSKAAT